MEDFSQGMSGLSEPHPTIFSALSCQFQSENPVQNPILQANFSQILSGNPQLLQGASFDMSTPFVSSGHLCDNT